jgi:hypothetical protein
MDEPNDNDSDHSLPSNSSTSTALPMARASIFIKDFKKPLVTKVDKPSVTKFLDDYAKYRQRVEDSNESSDTRQFPEGMRSCIDDYVVFMVRQYWKLESSDEAVNEEQVHQYLETVRNVQPPGDNTGKKVRARLSEILWNTQESDVYQRAGAFFFAISKDTSTNDLFGFYENKENQKLRADVLVTAIRKGGQRKLASAVADLVKTDAHASEYLSNIGKLQTEVVSLAQQCERWLPVEDETFLHARSTNNSSTDSAASKKRNNKAPVPWGTSAITGYHPPTKDNPPKKHHSSSSSNSSSSDTRKSGNFTCLNVRCIDKHHIDQCPHTGAKEKEIWMKKFRATLAALAEERKKRKFKKGEKVPSIVPAAVQAVHDMQKQKGSYLRAATSSLSCENQFESLSLEVELNNNTLLTLPSLLDSGTDNTLISTAMLTRIYHANSTNSSSSSSTSTSTSTPSKEGIIETTLATPLIYRLADPSNTLTCNKTVVLTFRLTTPAGRLVLRKVTVHVVEEDLDVILIGSDVLKSIGIDPLHNLNKQIASSSSTSSLVVDDSTNHKKQTNCSSSLPTSHSQPVKDSEGDDTDIEPPQAPSTEEQRDIQQAITTLVTDAVTNGLPIELKPRLQQIMENHKSIWKLNVGLEEPAKVTPMDIKLKPDATPIRCKARRYPPAHREFMHEHVKMLEEAGLVYRNPNSEWAAPALIVRKPTGGLRLCVDLRGVNDATVPSVWPMPNLECVLQSLEGTTCYATLDLWKGYWQFPLAEEKQECFSFMTHEGIFTPTRIIQGSKNAVNSFQAGMQETLGDLLYLLDRLDGIFNKFQERNIRCSVTKCHLFLTKAKWCGRIISAAGIEHDPARLKTLGEMPTPTNAAELQQFLCAMNWLRNALPDFNRVTEPLQNILEQALQQTSARKQAEAKKIPLKKCGWTSFHDQAFDRCRHLLLHAVRLAHPDPAKMFCLFTDASDHSWGAVLTQVPLEDLNLPVADQDHTPLQFLGGKFTKNKLNWSVCEKEAYAIVESCLRLEYLLLRPSGFKIFTDHRNLLYIFDPKYRSADVKKYTAAKLQRWALRLHAFSYTIEHISGDANVWADLLSRWASPPSSEEGQEVQLPSHTNVVSASSVNETTISTEDTPLELETLSHGTRKNHGGPRSILGSVENSGATADVASSVVDQERFSRQEPPPTTCVANTCNSSVIFAEDNREHSENTDRIVTGSARLRAAQCTTGVRPLQQENFIWPTTEEIISIQHKYFSTLEKTKTIFFIDSNQLVNLTDKQKTVSAFGFLLLLQTYKQE